MKQDLRRGLREPAVAWQIAQQRLRMKATDPGSAEVSPHSKWGERLSRWFAVPTLTRNRIWFALVVAMAVDSVQILLGPAGWLFADETLDVLAMVLTTAAIGFHTLLLPTFVIEFLPISDMLPTWTGCVTTVILLRKRAQAQAQPRPPKIIRAEPPLLTENVLEAPGPSGPIEKEPRKPTSAANPR